MFATDIYLRIAANSVQARNVSAGGDATSNSVGSFSHPRMLVGSFTHAQVAVKSAISEVAGAGFLRSLRILVHPLERIEGGLTEVEERVFVELARGAGAKKVVLWVGAALTDAAVKERLRAA